MTDKILKYTLTTLATLNILDYFFTLRAISLGFAEGNPAMDIALGTPLFALVKLVAVPLACFVIWRTRGKWYREWSLIFGLLGVVTVAYSAVMVWHVWGQFL